MGMLCKLLKKAWTLGLIVLAGYVGSYAAWYWLDHSASLCRVSLVPLGDVRESLLVDLVDDYRQMLGLQVELLSPIPIDDAVIDFKRRQLVAEELIALMKRRLPHLADDPGVMLMGITSGDIYTTHKNWRFAFAVRESGRFSVVSTARMDPGNFHLPPNDSILALRLKKMATKQLGLQYYGLRDRGEKTSVLFSPILGLDDLDEVSPDFDAADREQISKIVKSCKM